MSTFEEMMKEYADSQKQTSATKIKKYELSNYFSTYLEKGQNSASKQIRILPIKDKNVFWDILWGHKAQVDGSWKTFPCLKHEEDSDCPFCEANQALRATGKESDKELAKKYSAKKMYILKIIERGKEEEGVKFWRFNHAWDNGGTLDKIMGALKVAKHDITDPETGRDLVINIARNQFGIPVVQSVNNTLEVTKLSEDPNEAAVWLADNRTWRDVYSLRNYDYLKLVVRGEIPAWSKEQEKWVAKSSLDSATPSNKPEDEDDSELSLGGEAPQATVTETPVAPSIPVVEVPQTNAPEESVAPADIPKEVPFGFPTGNSTEEDEDDDLPF